MRIGASKPQRGKARAQVANGDVLVSIVMPRRWAFRLIVEHVSEIVCSRDRLSDRRRVGRFGVPHFAVRVRVRHRFAGVHAAAITR